MENEEREELEKVCARQKQEIIGLREELEKKEREVEEVARIARKYASVIPELRLHSFLPPLPRNAATDDISDYWGSAPTSSERLNFATIAAKGLWVVSSQAKPLRTTRRYPPTTQSQPRNSAGDSLPSLPADKRKAASPQPGKSLLRPELQSGLNRTKVSPFAVKSSLQRISEITVGVRRLPGKSLSPPRVIRERDSFGRSGNPLQA